MATATKTVWACPDCKSARVQAQVWVRINSGEVLDETGGYYWCDSCAEDGDDGEKKSLIELPAEETLEALDLDRDENGCA